MNMARGHLRADGMTDIVRAAFGTARKLRGVERLRGGTKKGVYRLTLGDDTTSVVYVWNDDEDYWPQAAQDRADIFGHATGLDLFEAAHRELSTVGVRVPEVLLYDRSRTLIAGDVAIIEDVAGGTLE